MIMSNLTNCNLLNRLKALQSSIRVALVGMGSMGRGLFYQSHITPGIECVVMADIKIERAIACAEWMKREYRVVNNLEAMHKTTRQGWIAICEDGNLAARCEWVDVLIEASSSITAAAQNRIASNNIISGWTGGTGTTYGLYLSSVTTNQVNNNNIYNITAGGRCYVWI